MHSNEFGSNWIKGAIATKSINAISEVDTIVSWSSAVK
tara:strand:- start:68 stop:181 length:114 start_codon:yes stop_codon:yes gene_type:complete